MRNGTGELSNQQHELGIFELKLVSAGRFVWESLGFGKIPSFLTQSVLCHRVGLGSPAARTDIRIKSVHYPYAFLLCNSVEK